MVSDMDESIRTLIAAIEAGYYKKEQWILWAQQALLTVKTVDGWLVDLYDAITAKDALAALYTGWHRLDWSNGSADQTSLVLGFLYLRYQDARLDIAELLHQAGEFADASNQNEPSCEAYYLLLNRYEACVRNDTYSAIEFEKEVNSLFSEQATKARQRLASLESAT